MTDEQIVKALDDVAKRGFKLCGLALDLINRQKAEIERLKSDNDILSKNMHNLCKELDAEKLKNF